MLACYYGNRITSSSIVYHCCIIRDSLAPYYYSLQLGAFTLESVSGCRSGRSGFLVGERMQLVDIQIEPFDQLLIGLLL